MRGAAEALSFFTAHPSVHPCSTSTQYIPCKMCIQYTRAIHPCSTCIQFIQHPGEGIRYQLPYPPPSPLPSPLLVAELFCPYPPPPHHHPAPPQGSGRPHPGLQAHHSAGLTHQQGQRAIGAGAQAGGGGVGWGKGLASHTPTGVWKCVAGAVTWT